MKHLSLFAALLLGLACNRQAPPENVPSYASTDNRSIASIVAWTPRKNDTPEVVYIDLSPAYVDEKGVPHRGKKLMWMQAGKTVVLPNWFTVGKDAQALPTNQLEDAWRRGTSGVYKMDYSAPVVRLEVFKGYKVEVN